MGEALKRLFADLLCENGTLCLTHIMSILAFIVFLTTSVYLMVNGKRWDHYDTFAAITGGGGVSAQVANKFITSKYGNDGRKYRAGEGK